MSSHEKMVSAYQMAINNTARYIRSRRNLFCEDGVPLDGFTASMVLAIAFCKAKEEVLSDIMTTNYQHEVEG